MKRCPECNSLFPDAEHFCELHGTLLVPVDEVTNPALFNRTAVVPDSKSNGTLLTIGALAGILVGVLLFLIYFAMTRQTAPENFDTTSSSSTAPQRESLRPLQPGPLASGNPSPEPSVEPSPSPSVEASPSPQNSATHVELSSSSPISTAGATGSSNPVIIRLNSGLTIEADEAWQTAEGIWVRQRGVLSLIDPKDVKAIEKVLPAAPQPSASTATPSP